jgi:hypothetical protein
LRLYVSGVYEKRKEGKEGTLTLTSLLSPSSNDHERDFRFTLKALIDPEGCRFGGVGFGFCVKPKKVFVMVVVVLQVLLLKKVEV